MKYSSSKQRNTNYSIKKRQKSVVNEKNKCKNICLFTNILGVKKKVENRVNWAEI